MSAASRARHAAPERRPEPRPDLTVVRRRRARRSMLTRLGTVMLFSLFVSVLGVVVFQTLRVQNQAKLDDINKRIAAEEDTTKALRLKLADAQAPDRIANDARVRLGMIPPNDIAYLQPKPDDDANAAWDPVKDPLPPPTTVAPPPTVPPTTLPPAPAPTAPKSTAKSAPSGSNKGSGSSTGSSTGQTKTTSTGAATPTTRAPSSTTPSTAKPAATATTAPTATGTKR